ncbi:MAG: TIGR02453 family protein [Planctomycetes bacterium RBG_13_63_9]|nr:MAG: TIGR02453 family protein [Planctomycetes bacterium RBG_13_63_9]
MRGLPDVEFRRFDPTIIQFLEELADNNNRPWFQENKGRYEREVLEPCLAFIRAFGPRLKRISPFFVASDRRIGGSLMRVYRDTRFSKDKQPYKTNVGIQFRHEFGRDVHAPGFYVHVAPDECFLGVGLWRPDRTSLGQIRQAIVDEDDRWRRASSGRRFREYFELVGDSLKRAPRGFPADHPLVEDLKRTDFIGLCELSEQDVLGKGLLDRTAKSFAASRPFMQFLCEALAVPF